MDEELAEVTGWLLDASALVGAPYFNFSEAGRDAAIYRERVYCYELYHQWRNRWRADFHFMVNGEVDKAGHHRFPFADKPDFAVHLGEIRGMEDHWPSRDAAGFTM